jgi:hypothetical protein
LMRVRDELIHSVSGVWGISLGYRKYMVILY